MLDGLLDDGQQLGRSVQSIFDQLKEPAAATDTPGAPEAKQRQQEKGGSDSLVQGVEAVGGEGHG